MHAVRQSVRPKHQVLILKCYPRFQKGVAEVKPNSSELSYLLYYASTRRSKVQKVGAFLEKKSTSDVPRGRLGNVQVTLHIIRALIDKSPRDLPLYAPYVLRILQLILNSKNLPMVEESVPTFQAFCEHHDAALLTADQDVAKEFENLVRGYGTFAAGESAPARSSSSNSIALKWRLAGLQAIKSITASEAIGIHPRQYLGIIMPVILDVLYAESAEEVIALKQRAHEEKEMAKKRRLSTATARTEKSVVDNHTTTRTAAEADRIVEEEAATIALQSLEQIFTSNNRLQIRWAAHNLTDCLVLKPLVSRPETARTSSTNQTSRSINKITTLVDMVANWTPVQDRFIILVTALEALGSSPMTEESMGKQLILALVIEYLLGSTINMIGLSVIDVLEGLIQHVLRVLKLGGHGTDVLPQHQTTGNIDLFNQAGDVDDAKPPGRTEAEASREIHAASTSRQELLSRLRGGIGNLATHIYYSEQVRDIIRELLDRLKPPVSSNLPGASAAIERPDEAAHAVAQSGNMVENGDSEDFFSFGTARVTALNAVRDVLIIANNKGIVTGAGAFGRSRVSVQLWEGTQWLLRDEDRRVRRAYAEALLTWLQLEMSKHDLRVLQESPKAKKNKSANHERSVQDITRSVSSASPSSKSRLSKSTFLQLLHLAVYDNALEAPEDDFNILLMHLLLVSLVQKLGVNASRCGLPMIVRLQEDINTTSQIESPKAKVNVGSLVHGYLWALSDVFEFDTTMVGFELQDEISRRKKAGLWLEAVSVPPKPFDLIVAQGLTGPRSIPSEIANQQALRPFDHVREMVAQITMAYATTVSSPPVSPPLSPGRVFAVPLAAASNQPKATDVLPADFKEAMLGRWSKEVCIANAEKARTASPHGSRSGTTRSAPNGLLSTDGRTPREHSPVGIQAHSKTRGRIPSAFMPLQTGQLKRANAGESGPATPVSNSSDHTGTLRVDDLKRVLAGGALADAFSSQGHSSVRTSSPLRNSQTAAHDFAEADRPGRASTRKSVVSTGSESIVDAEGFESAEEGDVEHPLPGPHPAIESSELAQEPGSNPGRRPSEHGFRRNSVASDKGRDHTVPTTPTSPSRRSIGRARSASETSTEDPEANYRALRGGMPSDVVRGSIVGDDGVPPVPPLPEALLRKNNITTNGNATLPAQPGTAAAALPAGLAIPNSRSTTMDNRPRSINNIDSGVEGEGSIRGSVGGSVHGSVGRRSMRAAGSEKRNMVEALLGSIEVNDSGGKGIGKPPY